MSGFDFSGANETKGAAVTATTDKAGMVFDLSGVEESVGFEVMPKGTYDAVVDEFDFGESKAGNPMITVKYAITTPEYENRVIFDYMVLSGDGAKFGLGKLKKFLLRVCPEVNISQFDPQQFSDLGTGVGRLCRLVIGIRTQKSGEYKGEKQNNVKDILAPEEGSFI